MRKKAGIQAQLKSFLSAPMRFGMLPRNAQIISLDKDFPWNESDVALPWRHCVSCCKTMVWKIQIQGLNKWEKGLTVPNAYQFIALCRILGIEDCMVGMESVLLNDTGLRKLDEYKMDLIASGRYRPTSERYTETYIEMPISTLAVSAGVGEFLDEGGFEMIRFPKSAVPSNADFGVRVNGIAWNQSIMTVRLFGWKKGILCSLEK